MRTHKLKIQEIPLKDIALLAGNPRRGNIDAVAESMEANGVYQPVIINRGTHTGREMEVIAGNHRVQAAQKLGLESIPAIVLDITDSEAKRIALADNRTSDLAEYDAQALLDMLDDLDDLVGTGYDLDDLDELRADLEEIAEEIEPEKEEGGSLEEQFGTPPFTTLSARGGAWQARKRAWAASGIESVAGRQEELVSGAPNYLYTNFMDVKEIAEKAAGKKLTNQEILDSEFAEKLVEVGGTSTFDAALCEILYRWFSREGDEITDPWAGGSVRGIVASAMGRHYTGHELRQEQVDENRAQVEESRGNYDGWAGDPTYVLGDSRKTLAARTAGSADMVIGCPPYYDLEVYSDLADDLSTMSPKEFDASMVKTMREVARVLRQDRFAVFIVGNVRNKKGELLSMHRCMLNAAEAAGLTYTQDAILLTQVGTAALRSPRQFKQTRVLARTHQEILVFVKGDRKKAAKRLGDVDVSIDLQEAVEEMERENDAAAGEAA